MTKQEFIDKKSEELSAYLTGKKEIKGRGYELAIASGDAKRFLVNFLRQALEEMAEFAVYDFVTEVTRRFKIGEKGIEAMDKVLQEKMRKWLKN